MLPPIEKFTKDESEPILTDRQKSYLILVADKFKQNSDKVLKELLQPGTVYINKEWIKKTRDIKNNAGHKNEMTYGLVVQIMGLGEIFTKKQDPELNYDVGTIILALLSEDWGDYTTNLSSYLDTISGSF